MKSSGDMNRFSPHLLVIPKDDANRQIATGFTLHHAVQSPRMQVMPVAGGWSHVLKTFETEYLRRLQTFSHAHILMLIDFDDDVLPRLAKFHQAIPATLQSRTFVIGTRNTPEILKKALGMTFEKIGLELAAECSSGDRALWSHDELRHNEPEVLRLIETVKPFLMDSISA